MQSEISIIKLSEVLKMTCQSQSTLWRQIKAGTFVPPVNIAPRAVGYIQQEVQSVLSARAAGWDEKRIKTLVKKLVAERKERANRLFDEIAA